MRPAGPSAILISPCKRRLGCGSRELPLAPVVSSTDHVFHEEPFPHNTDMAALSPPVIIQRHYVQHRAGVCDKDLINGSWIICHWLKKSKKRYDHRRIDSLIDVHFQKGDLRIGCAIFKDYGDQPAEYRIWTLHAIQGYLPSLEMRKQRKKITVCRNGYERPHMSRWPCCSPQCAQ